MIYQTDICIIGAGPSGLFAVFEAGWLRLRSHVVDALPKPGGQLSALYPHKPIYDVPGLPKIIANDLIANLLHQIQPYHPGMSLGVCAERLEKRNERDFRLHCADGTVVEAKAVVIAGGLGSFEARKPELPGIERFEGKGLSYCVTEPEVYRKRRVVIAGGGDAALDWAIVLADIAADVTLVHRRDSFRAAPDSIRKIEELAAAGRINLMLNTQLNSLEGEENLNGIGLHSADGSHRMLPAEELLVLYGFAPKLGPIENWGLELENKSIRVNPERFSTSMPGVFAIGDICTYPGKLKLILCGFHEAAMAAHAAYSYIHQGAKAAHRYSSIAGPENPASFPQKPFST